MRTNRNDCVGNYIIIELVAIIKFHQWLRLKTKTSKADITIMSVSNLFVSRECSKSHTNTLISTFICSISSKYDVENNGVQDQINFILSTDLMTKL